MDFDPRMTSDGKGYGAENGVHCNFHYGYVHDVVDEDAKNEEACVQALRHLIAKADADIADLEDELAILQCQRRWAESDELKNPFEVCCAAFKRKIETLTSAIQSLRNGVDTSEIPRPADRIHDIIDALIRSNFTEPNEQSQEGDLYDETNLVVSSGSLNIDTDEKQEATSLELSLESEKQTPVFERLDKPTQTVSEESFSDAARYTTKDFTEVRSIGSSIVEVSEEIESAEHPSEEKRGFFTNIETIDSQSPLQASNDEGNSKPTALQCEEIESCMGGSKTSESMSSMLAANTGVMIKVDQDGHDTNIQHDSARSFSRVQNHGAKDSVEANLEALENQALCVSDYEITYARKKSGLSPKLQMKNLDVVSSLIPSQTLKPQKTITKRKSFSTEENFGRSGSPSSEIERGVGFLPETNRRSKLKTGENTAIRDPLQISQGKKRQPELKVPEGSLVATGSVAPVSPGRNTACLKLLSPIEVRDSAVTSLADTLNPGSSHSTVKKTKIELPFGDLESLKRRISEEPNFLKNQKVPQLRQIAQLCMLHGRSKATKETLIERLSKYLADL